MVQSTWDQSTLVQSTLDQSTLDKSLHGFGRWSSRVVTAWQSFLGGAGQVHLFSPVPGDMLAIISNEDKLQEWKEGTYQEVLGLLGVMGVRQEVLGIRQGVLGKEVSGRCTGFRQFLVDR